MSLLDFLKYGGLIGAIILLGSVAALGISIERAIGLKRDNIVPPDILAQLEQLFDDEEYEEAMTICESQPNFLCNVIAALLVDADDRLAPTALERRRPRVDHSPHGMPGTALRSAAAVCSSNVDAVVIACTCACRLRSWSME